MVHAEQLILTRDRGKQEERKDGQMSPPLCCPCFLSPVSSVTHTHFQVEGARNFIGTHMNMFDIDTEVLSVLFTPALCMKSKAACSTSSVLITLPLHSLSPSLSLPLLLLLVVPASVKQNSCSTLEMQAFTSIVCSRSHCT